MIQLALKDGASIGARHFDACMMPVWQVILEKCPATSDGYLYVTSGNDSHAAGLHPNFRALDIRTKNVKGTGVAEHSAEPNRQRKVKLFAERIWQRLGDDYDVRLEALGQDNEHIHIEYDPKA